MLTYDVEATNAKVFSKLGLFSMRGRRNRKPYFFMNFLISSIENVIIKAANPNSDVVLIVTILISITSYLLFINTAKRLQDLNYPGWFAIIVCIPNLIYLFSTTAISPHLFNLMALVLIPLHLYILFKKGTSGPNFYGPDPLEHNA